MTWRYLVWFPVATIILTAVVYVTKTLMKRPTWQQLLVIVALVVASFVASWAGNRILLRNTQPEDLK